MMSKLLQLHHCLFMAVGFWSRRRAVIKQLVSLRGKHCWTLTPALVSIKLQIGAWRDRVGGMTVGGDGAGNWCWEVSTVSPALGQSIDWAPHWLEPLKISPTWHPTLQASANLRMALRSILKPLPVFGSHFWFASQNWKWFVEVSGGHSETHNGR